MTVARREVIHIDEKLCDGCGECVPSCAEGALAIVGGKARLANDAYCDGLGACLGHCPQGAITVVERQAAPFDAAAVQRHLAEQCPDAGRQPAARGIPVRGSLPAMGEGCPGSRAVTLVPPDAVEAGAAVDGHSPSRLQHWPVQLHLVPPAAPFYRGADVLLAADCSAFAVGDFHDRFLRGRALAIACPKLDGEQDRYVAKLAAMLDKARIRSLTVLVMEVPCCNGLVQLARRALAASARPVPVSVIVVSATGAVLVERTLVA
jgi:ferredoxin